MLHFLSSTHALPSIFSRPVFLNLGSKTHKGELVNIIATDAVVRFIFDLLRKMTCDLNDRFSDLKEFDFSSWIARPMLKFYLSSFF